MFPFTTWTCHVCGDRRPDAKISVHKKQKELAPGIPVDTNIRYCNDRATCIQGAPHVDLLGQTKAH